MTLSFEQQQALDALFAQVQAQGRKDGRAHAAAGQPVQTAQLKDAPDLLKVWTGIPAGQLKEAVGALLGRKDSLEADFLRWTDRNPMEAAFEFLGTAAWAFYLAEKDTNPRIKTFVDSFYYIATCASVGYADIFAVTQTGRAIGALVMIYGPAITNKALDKPK